MSFVVSGGTPGYTVTSNNPAIAAVSSVSSSGGQYIFTATLVAAGSDILTLTDSAQKLTTINLTVTALPTSSLYTTAPAAVTIAAGGAASYTMAGGTAPYTATSSNTAVATASANGTTLGITGVANGTASIVIHDAAGASLTVVVTVGGSGTAAALYTTAPSAVTLATAGTASYIIAGGTAPYTASSSNTAVATVNVSSPTMTVAGMAAGTANIVVHDAAGASVAIAVTVANSAGAALYTSAPLAITIAAIGGSQTYTIGGGTAPYTVTSDNTNVASIAGSSGTSLAITGVADGKANVRVQDATGSASVTIAVNVATGAGFTVIGSTPTWTISGNHDGILTNDCISSANSPYSVYFVNGGTPPYTVASSNPLVGTIIGTDSAPPTLPVGPQSVSLNSVTVAKGGYFVVAWPNFNNSCASGVASFKVIDSAGLVPAVTPTFTVNFTPS